MLAKQKKEIKCSYRSELMTPKQWAIHIGKERFLKFFCIKHNCFVAINAASY